MNGWEWDGDGMGLVMTTKLLLGILVTISSSLFMTGAIVCCPCCSKRYSIRLGAQACTGLSPWHMLCVCVCVLHLYVDSISTNASGRSWEHNYHSWWNRAWFSSPGDFRIGWQFGSVSILARKPVTIHAYAAQSQPWLHLDSFSRSFTLFQWCRSLTCSSCSSISCWPHSYQARNIRSLLNQDREPGFLSRLLPLSFRSTSNITIPSLRQKARLCTL